MIVPYQSFSYSKWKCKHRVGVLQESQPRDYGSNFGPIPFASGGMDRENHPAADSPRRRRTCVRVVTGTFEALFIPMWSTAGCGGNPKCRAFFLTDVSLEFTLMSPFSGQLDLILSTAPRICVWHVCCSFPLMEVRPLRPSSTSVTEAD